MTVIFYFIFTLSGLTLMKYDKLGLNLSFDKSVFSLNFGLPFILGAVSYIISFFIYIMLVRKYDLSYLLPFVNGIVIISSTLIGIFLFKEVISPVKIIGIVLIVAGLTLINLKGA